MAAKFLAEAEKMIFDALDGIISAPVLTYVEQEPDGKPRVNFPAVFIGQDDFHRWNRDDKRGVRTLCRISVWTSEKGNAQVKLLMGEIYDILEAKSFVGETTRSMDGTVIYQTVLDYEDKITHKGVLHYQMYMHEL